MDNSNQKYNPWNANAQSWELIESRYMTDWREHVQLLQLVRHIKNSNLAERLFGSISMDKLVIGNCDPIDYRKEALHITFDLEKKMWHCEYKEDPFQEPKFIRDYTEEYGLTKLENFIKMIRW
jgi:hypothetical protein